VKYVDDTFYEESFLFGHIFNVSILV